MSSLLLTCSKPSSAAGLQPCPPAHDPDMGNSPMMCRSVRGPDLRGVIRTGFSSNVSNVTARCDVTKVGCDVRDAWRTLERDVIVMDVASLLEERLQRVCGVDVQVKGFFYVMSNVSWQLDQLIINVFVHSIELRVNDMHILSKNLLKIFFHAVTGVVFLELLISNNMNVTWNAKGPTASFNSLFLTILWGILIYIYSCSHVMLIPTDTLTECPSHAIRYIL